MNLQTFPSSSRFHVLSQVSLTAKAFASTVRSIDETLAFIKPEFLTLKLTLFFVHLTRIGLDEYNSNGSRSE